MLSTYKNKEPDILEVISDLSNEEVFTPPEVARSLLAQLPTEVWVNPDLRWIDPFSKTGIFLREITRGLLVGLKEVIPDEKERLEHILRKMVFGVAVTELTSLMTRRSVYCSRNAGSPKSAVQMDKPQGNIVFGRLEHEFLNRKCGECHAAEAIYGSTDVNVENHAYALLHQRGRELISEEIGMKFDIVVGNPPYQIEVDEAGQNINPLYHLFIHQAKQLAPKYISMVIPSRWMAAGKGLGNFRQEMLGDTRLKKISDFPDAEDVFPGVGKTIEGGICYFLWDRDYSGPCEFQSIQKGSVKDKSTRYLNDYDVLVRNSQSIVILEKVLKKNLPPVSEIVSTRDPFGPALSSNFKNYSLERNSASDLVLYMNKGSTRLSAFVSDKLVTRNQQLVDAWKVFVPKARGVTKSGPDVVIGTPILAEPGSVCTLTYLAIGPFETKQHAQHFVEFLQTRIGRFLISLRKPTQDTTQSSYQWLPLLDLSKSWTDDKLASLFDLNESDLAFINERIRELNT